MWPDNETTVDLLGFDYLVDQLEVLVTNRRLTPLTVLVSGDWGSGKSSLMKAAADRLRSDENRERFVVVEFVPWRFEDFAFGKVALMAAVIDAIGEHIEAKAEDASGGKQTAVKKLTLARLALQKVGFWKAATVAGMTAAGVNPTETAAVAAMADFVGGIGPTLGDAEDPSEELPREFTSVADFQVVFEELVESLGKSFEAVVVFIDDMDRCSSTQTIVETFEAMRLFLQAPKTAYIVGAQEKNVEAALNSRFEARRDDDDENLGEHWLEKMLQRRLPVPPLGPPEVLTYINLLFAELFTTPENFEELRAAAVERRKSNPFQIAMNQGLAADTIGELPEEFAEGLHIAEQIGPTLARTRRGNPRAIKSFLNDIYQRLETARMRQMSLDPATVAKMLVLEQLLDAQHFERVFGWFLDSDTGKAEELGPAEAYAKTGNGGSQTIREWVAQPGVAEWLKLEPSLAETNLGPYFTFSRDRLAGLITAPRLTEELQRLLSDLQNRTDPTRRRAVTEALTLSDADRTQLLPALLTAAERDLDGAAGTSLRAIAAVKPDVATAMFAALERLPIRKVKGTFALNLANDMKGDPRTRMVLEKWEGKGPSGFRRQVTRALGSL